MKKQPLASIKDLTKFFLVKSTQLFQKQRAYLRAVDGISFDIHHEETLGLVGESGCGKSTAARLILRLLEPTRGEVWFGGKDILLSPKSELRGLRRQIQMVFQDPLSSLNPRMTVGVSIGEPLSFHGLSDRMERDERARELLEIVGLTANDFDRFPHELSGGQCQRIAIARALILKPKLVVLDEAVSALDVSIRAQILNLLIELQVNFGLTYLFISHDLSVVKRFCNRILVMYLGQIVELGDSQCLYQEPLHPYTKALLSAIPSPDFGLKRVTDLGTIKGDVPSLTKQPRGCRFHSRCPSHLDICFDNTPPLKSVGSEHRVACFLYD